MDFLYKWQLGIIIHQVDFPIMKTLYKLDGIRTFSCMDFLYKWQLGIIIHQVDFPIMKTLYKLDGIRTIYDCNRF